jgi:hypothetical protein
MNERKEKKMLKMNLNLNSVTACLHEDDHAPLRSP